MRSYLGASGKAEEDALCRLELALGRITALEKTDFLRALQVAPEVVAKESDPIRWLRFTNFDEFAAARGIVKYWKLRREVFQEKAFFPMVLRSENSALDGEVIDAVKNGRGVILPNDNEGCSVLCMDLSRHVFPPSKAHIRHQFTWYITHLLSMNPQSQTKGFVNLNPLHDLKRLTVEHCERVNGVLGAFPIRKKAWHFLNCLPSWNREGSYESAIHHAVQQLGPLVREFNVLCHLTSKPKEMLKILEAYGLRKEGIPTNLGGTWSYEQCLSDNTTQRKVAINVQDTDTGSDKKPAAKTNKKPAAKADKKPAAKTDKKPSKPDETLISQWEEEVGKYIFKLPPEETKAFMEALAKSPNNIYKEAGGVDAFLRAEHFNFRFAALRLVRYWSLRSKTFGPQKYLPLAQTGEGALRKQDIQVLLANFVNLLPNDPQGCPVLWTDETNVPRASPGTSRERCLFYMFSILTENTKSQDEGAVLLYRREKGPFARIEPDYIERLTQALPLRFKAVHVFAPENTDKDSGLNVHFADEVDVHTHMWNTSDGLAAKVKSCGLSKSGLPKALEGEWDLAKFLLWSEFRTRMEFQIPQGFGRTDAEGFRFPGITRYALLPDEQKDEKNRRLNIIHCRRKRDRNRLAVGALKDQCAELKDEKDAMVAENGRLESLLQSAIGIVSSIEEGFPIEASCRHLQAPMNEEESFAPAFRVGEQSARSASRKRDSNERLDDEPNNGNVKRRRRSTSVPEGGRQRLSYASRQGAEDRRSETAETIAANALQTLATQQQSQAHSHLHSPSARALNTSTFQTREALIRNLQEQQAMSTGASVAARGALLGLHTAYNPSPLSLDAQQATQQSLSASSFGHVAPITSADLASALHQRTRQHVLLSHVQDPVLANQQLELALRGGLLRGAAPPTAGLAENGILTENAILQLLLRRNLQR